MLIYFRAVVKSFRAEHSEPDATVEQPHRRHLSGSTTPSETSDGIPNFALHLSCVMCPIAERSGIYGSGFGSGSGAGGAAAAAAPDVMVQPQPQVSLLSPSRPSDPLLAPNGSSISPSQLQQQRKRWSVIPANSLSVNSTTGAHSRTSIRALQKRAHNARFAPLFFTPTYL